MPLKNFISTGIKKKNCDFKCINVKPFKNLKDFIDLICQKTCFLCVCLGL